MDPLKTAPFDLGAGDDACLLVHGFTGSPWDMRPLGEALAARGYYVKGLRLPGHGLTPQALAQVTHRDWEQAVEDGLAALANFRHVFVVGLSMGALLSLRLAARHQDRVHALALLAPALRMRSWKLRLAKRFGRTPLLHLLRPHLEKESTDLEDPAERAEAPILPRVPTARLHDLWRVQDEAMQALPLVRCPVLVALADQDHVVDSALAARVLSTGLKSAPAVRFLRLEQGFHIVTRDRGRGLLLRELGTFLDQQRGGPGGV